MNSLARMQEVVADEWALRGFAELMTHLCELYTFGESSSVSEAEAHALGASLCYVLGWPGDEMNRCREALASDDVIAIWTERRRALEAHETAVMALWHQVVTTMPPLRNLALRDTLESIGNLRKLYDTTFAAHEVPGSIDYPLSVPVSDDLRGLDYLEAWLSRLLEEARFLSQFDVGQVEAYLEGWCPDYRGLLINLYDPIFEAWQNHELEMR